MTDYHWYIIAAYSAGLGGLFGYLLFAGRQKKLQLQHAKYD